MTQQQALAIMKTGANVFLTGEPGSGKTHTVNEYVSYLKARGVEPAITASTGIAATHIGGMTIHSWSGIGIKTTLTKEDLQRIKSNSRVANRIKRAEVLIIDEVSMLSPATLDMVEAVCRAVKNSHDPFGGIQVILVGDFFQLPPVQKVEEIKKFAYDSPVWTKTNFANCYLTEQHRQDDSIFLSLLSAIRRNAFDHLPHIESRQVKKPAVSDNILKLFSHNADVDRVNDEMLAKLSGETKKFEMFSEGSETILEALIKGCLSPQTLRLKPGSAVMFTKNNRMAGFVNGTLGIIDSFGEETGRPIVKMRSGRKIEVEPMDWTVEENGRILARITQLPLRLAWAITVHKSQGMSLDEAFMDLSNVFEFGQGYVALSRVRRLTGLYISGWNERTFQVHPDVLAKDEFFRNEARKAEAKLASTTPAELRKLQNDFITACGGRNSPTGESAARIAEPGSGFDEIRKTHPSAYRPWDASEDQKLREFFSAGIPVAEIAKQFGRKRGAITSRLKKLAVL